jgi:hypothetical protein
VPVPRPLEERKNGLTSLASGALTSRAAVEARCQPNEAACREHQTFNKGECDDQTEYHFSWT